MGKKRILKWQQHVWPARLVPTGEGTETASKGRMWARVSPSDPVSLQVVVLGAYENHNTYNNKKYLYGVGWGIYEYLLPKSAFDPSTVNSQTPLRILDHSDYCDMEENRLYTFQDSAYERIISTLTSLDIPHAKPCISGDERCDECIKLHKDLGQLLSVDLFNYQIMKEPEDEGYEHEDEQAEENEGDDDDEGES